MLVFPDISLVHAAFLRGQMDEFLIVELDAQLFGKHFSQKMAAAAELAGDGDDPMPGKEVFYRQGCLSGGFASLSRRIEEAVEHLEPRTDEMDDRPDNDSGHHRSFPDPLDCPHHGIGDNAGECHQGTVES